MKRAFSVLLATLFLMTALPLGAIPVFAASSGKTSACTWTLDDDGHLTISGNGSMGNYSDGTKYDWWGTSITSVTIEEGVTSIGSWAFSYCENLTSVIVADSVKTIGNYAFYRCTNLVSITSLDSVTSIGENAFYGCSNLTSVTLGEELTSIGSSAFAYCDSLSSINIPDSVTSIGSGAFRCCTDLTAITIPDGVTSISGSTFWECNNLSTVTIGNSVTTIGTAAFYKCSALTEITIPDSVITIGERAFNQSGLTTVIIPDGVTTIGVNAFSGCNQLVSVAIPKSVISIGSGAFNGCVKLESTYISDIAAWCGIRFSGYDANPLYHGGKLYLNGEVVTDLIIPDGVTSIGEYAFYGCETLTSVTIPDSIQAIGAGAFNGCTGINAVYAPDIATWCAIDFGGNGANPLWSSYSRKLYFNGELATNLIVPDDITVIDEYAFCRCADLETITIPDSVISIGGRAFYECDQLTSVTLGKNITSIGGEAFENCNRLTAINIPDSVTSIGGGAFYKCSSLSSVTIPEGITTIHGDTFAYCNGITSLTLPATVTNVASSAFLACYQLTVYYHGTPQDRAAMSVGSNNTPFTSATWHYFTGPYDTTCNECGEERAVSIPIDFSGNSVSEEKSGLAFRFDVLVEGVAVKGTKAIYTNATVDGYKLLSMGAVVANDISQLDIPAVYLCDLEADSAGFAVRVTNIPADKYDATITATPYMVLEIDGVATRIYGEAQTCFYNAVTN